jgi:hypothetical protein
MARTIKAIPERPPQPDTLLPEDAPFGNVPTSGRGGRLRGEILGTREAAQLEREIEREDGRCTRPWKDEEFIYLNGVPHCYEPNREVGTLIRLRGGGRMLLRDAYVKNMSISGPRNYRLDDLYVTAAPEKNVKVRMNNQ